jgi:WD40 repeat protein
LFRADGPVVSLAMDELNNEGIVGTSHGTLYYINFNDKLMIKMVNKAYSVQKPITQVKFEESNPQLIISNVCCSEGNGSGIVKVWTSQTLDQVMRFASAPDNSGAVCFVLSGTNGGKFSVIGHQSGLIRLVNIENLKIDSSYRLTMQSPDELMSCAVFNPNGVNIAIGTNQGNIYLGSIKEDSQGRPKVMFGRLDINGSAVGTPQTVTSLQFSQFDPIGSFLVSYDNGVVKTW